MNQFAAFAPFGAERDNGILETFFATVPRGLEGLLTEDLLAAGARECAATHGGVEFVADWAIVYALNLRNRLAGRILWRVGKARYQNEEDVYRAVNRLPWPELFDRDLSMRVFVTARASPLKSLDFITLRIKDAVCDKFRSSTGVRPNVDTREPDVRIHAYFERERMSIYLDTTGAPLWQRGHRVASADAPLRENLAAGILRLAGWRPGITLLDPMCGGGTFLIEAAEITFGLDAGRDRPFAFERLVAYAPRVWKAVKAASRAAAVAEHAGLYGRDVDARALKQARANAQAAGVFEALDLARGDILEVMPPTEQGIMLANPPYGERIGELERLGELYPKLGAHLKHHYAGWNCYFLTADLRLAKGVGLAPTRRTPLFNGPLECRLFEFLIIAGSMRRVRADAAPTVNIPKAD